MIEHTVVGYIIYWILALIGITYGYHRYFAHGEVTPKRAWVECIMLFCGNLCGITSPLTWVGVHRMHHDKHDTNLDPHSPAHQSWFSIIFTRWKVQTIPRKYIKDVIKNPRVVFFHNHGTQVWLATLVACSFHSIILALQVCVAPVILARLGYGLLNYFGHKNGVPVNRPLLNIIAPMEGNHAKHHV